MQDKLFNKQLTHVNDTKVTLKVLCRNAPLGKYELKKSK